MKRKKTYHGCDEDCEHCPYPDCYMPAVKAAQGINADQYVFMKDGISEDGQRVRMTRHVSHRQHPNGRAVRCIETGVVYPSVSEASRQTGAWASDISKNCRKKIARASGLHWEYVK